MDIIASLFAMMVGFGIAIGAGMLAVELFRSARRTGSIWLQILALIPMLFLVLVALIAFLMGSCFGLVAVNGGR